MNYKFVLFTIICFIGYCSKAQSLDDSTAINIKERDTANLKFKYKSLIIPTVFIGYGVIGLESGQIKGFNSGVRTEVAEHIDEKLSIDDFSQYAPLAAVYGLSAMGVESKSSYKKRLIVSSTAALLMALTVNSFKMTASVERPDGTSFNSFPSGHTATAFMGAELMHQEYKHQSIWYSVAGYTIATGTGAFRMYNNRHWLSDVVAGAGVGILSAKAGYWLYPYVSKIFNCKKQNTATSFVPMYDGKQMSFGLISRF
jgi:hypothetical protein